MNDISQKTCRRGHVGMYNKHRNCTECKRITSLADYRANPEKFKERKQRLKARDPKAYKRKQRERYAVRAERISENARKRRVANPLKELIVQARIRARKGGFPFAITEADITMPAVCPLLGIELKVGLGKFGPCSPTLDKIVPALGYVPGNVVVISHRANAIKNNATLYELQTLVANLTKLFPVPPL